MNERLVFVILLGVISILWYIVGYWRRKAGETAFLAAQKTEKEDERDRLCRLAVRAGHRDACRMFCCLHPDLFKEQPPLKPFKLHGTKVVFYGQYYRPGTNRFSTMISRRSAIQSMSSRREKYTALSFSNLA